jgi:hypothetical protein
VQCRYPIFGLDWKDKQIMGSSMIRTCKTMILPIGFPSTSTRNVLFDECLEIYRVLSRLCRVPVSFGKNYVLVVYKRQLRDDTILSL